MFTCETSGKIELDGVKQPDTNRNVVRLTFNIYKLTNFQNLDEKPNMRINNVPTQLGNSDSNFTDFKYNDANQYGNSFNQRYKLLFGHDIERDVTQDFSNVSVRETVLLQFMTNNVYMRVIYLHHSGKYCAFYVETSKFGVYKRETSGSIKLKGIFQRGLNPTNATAAFNIYKLSNFLALNDKPAIVINNTHIGANGSNFA